MTPTQYQTLRRKLGTQEQIAKLLDVTTMTLNRREKKGGKVTREAEFALRWLARER